MAYSEGYEAAQREFNSPAAKALNNKFVRRASRGLKADVNENVRIMNRLVRYGKGLGKAEASGKSSTVKRMNDEYRNGLIIPKIRQRVRVKDNEPIDKLEYRQNIKDYLSKMGKKSPEHVRDFIKDDMKRR